MDRIPRQYLIFDEIDKMRESSYYQQEKLPEEPDSRVHDISNIIKESLQTGRVDADEIVEILFPNGYSDVFISHSHAEVDVALALKAKIVHELGLSCFIDGEVWGNVYSALEHFQKEWRLHENADFLSKCNLAASHFFLMLSSALMQMMGQSRAILFIKPESAFKTGEDEKVLSIDSAWIRQELLIAKQLMPLDIQKRMRWMGPMMLAYQPSRTPQFFYNVDLEYFERILYEQLPLIKDRMSIEYWKDFQKKREEAFYAQISKLK